jgi:sec-independent protein translocase protein TatB
VRKPLRAPAALLRQRGFLDFSFSELAIIFGLALVVLGPKKLPGLVQQVGRWVGRARQMARQFREQLEQEVNAINEVKPVPRPVAPEVGPAAPGSAPAPDIHTASGSTDATGVEPDPAPATSATDSATAPSAPANDLHPEAQIYFAMNGSQPEAVAQDPYAPAPAVDDPQVAADPASPAAQAAPPAPAKPAEPAQPASVEVVFPHDHG